MWENVMTSCVENVYIKLDLSFFFPSLRIENYPISKFHGSS